jgi:hypothetical protein
MKPHRELAHYLAEIETALRALPAAYVESYVEEVLTPTRANLRVRVRFSGGQILAMSEAVVIADETLVHLDYRYHCQGPDNELLFRYDSAPHFPELFGFPQHKHLANGVVSAARPEIRQLLAEASVSDDETGRTHPTR